MGGKVIAITVSGDEYRLLEKAAEAEGIKCVGTLARRYVLRAAGLRQADGERRTVEVPVDNYRELESYVALKKLGSVAVFATYAMAQTMARYPLTEAQKAKVVKSDG